VICCSPEEHSFLMDLDILIMLYYILCHLYA